MGLVDSRPRFCRSLYSVGNSVQWPKLPGYAYLHSALFVAKSGFGLKRVCTLSRKRRRRFILDSIANDKRSLIPSCSSTWANDVRDNKIKR